MRRILDRLTYANIMATFAVFLGLTGTAYAATVANNSVGSPQIIDGSVKSIDLGNGQVTGTDVAEGTLAKVPAAVNADKLGGFSAAAYHRAVANASGYFTSNLAPSITGYGDYGLYCGTDGVHWYDNLTALGSNARFVANLSWSDGPYTASETDVLAITTGGAGTTVAQGERFYARAFIQNAAGTKKLVVEAWGMGHNDSDVNTSQDCWGSVEAWRVK